ncbi:28490_t:CDS:1, partial [Racocetra persica]
NVNHERRQNEKEEKGGHGAKCNVDDDCACPFDCRFRGEDTFKCQTTDTRGFEEACPACSDGLVCKACLRCGIDNDLKSICVDSRDNGMECDDNNNRCLSGIGRKYGENANTCQSSDTQKTGETCHNRFARASGNCEFNKNGKRVCCDITNGKKLCCDITNGIND